MEISVDVRSHSTCLGSSHLVWRVVSADLRAAFVHSQHLSNNAPTHISLFNHSVDFHPLQYLSAFISLSIQFNLVKARLIILSAPSFNIKCLWLSSG